MIAPLNGLYLAFFSFTCIKIQLCTAFEQPDLLGNEPRQREYVRYNAHSSDEEREKKKKKKKKKTKQKKNCIKK